MADIKNQYLWCNNDVYLVDDVSGGPAGCLLLPPSSHTVSPVQTTYAADFNHFLYHPAIMVPRDDGVRASTSIHRSGPSPVFDARIVEGALSGPLVGNCIH